MTSLSLSVDHEDNNLLTNDLKNNNKPSILKYKVSIYLQLVLKSVFCSLATRKGLTYRIQELPYIFVLMFYFSSIKIQHYVYLNIFLCIVFLWEGLHSQQCQAKWKVGMIYWYPMVGLHNVLQVFYKDMSTVISYTFCFKYSIILKPQ